MKLLYVFVIAALAASVFGAPAKSEEGRIEKLLAVKQKLDKLRARDDEATADLEKVSITHAGIQRTYLLAKPEGTLAGTKLPLVVVLHGGGGNGANAVRMTGFDALARKEGFLAAFPDGSAKKMSPFHTWNAGHCCQYAMESKADDAGFLMALVDHLVATQNADPARVFITGMSNGAMMAHRLAREYPQKIAGIAPVVGALFGDEPQPSQGVPVMIVNGAMDANVPPAGGHLAGDKSRHATDGTPVKSTVYQAEYWALANGCEPKPALAQAGAPQIEKRVYTCPKETPLVHYLLADGTHSWPGGEKGRHSGDQPSGAMNATAAIWAFFKALPSRSAPR